MTHDNANASQHTHDLAEIDVSPERAEQWNDLELSQPSIERLDRAKTHDSDTLGALRSLDSKLKVRVTELGPSNGLIRYVGDAESYHDALDRLAVIQTVEVIESRRRTTGQRRTLTPVPWPGWTNPADPHRRARCLTDIESGLVRLVAMSRGAGAAALIGTGEAGAIAGESGRITAPMIDVEKHSIVLPGTNRHVAPREAAIPPWCVPSFETIVAPYADDEDAIDDPVLYSGHSNNPAVVQSSLSMNALNVLKAAGLGGDPAVSFGSLRHTAARTIYDITKSTDEAVQFLGEQGHDNVRRKIGLTPAPERPPRNR